MYGCPWRLVARTARKAKEPMSGRRVNLRARTGNEGVSSKNIRMYATGSSAHATNTSVRARCMKAGMHAGLL